MPRKLKHQLRDRIRLKNYSIRSNVLIITDAGRAQPAEITEPDTGQSCPEAGHKLLCARFYPPGLFFVPSVPLCGIPA